MLILFLKIEVKCDLKFFLKLIYLEDDLRKSYIYFSESKGVPYRLQLHQTASVKARANLFLLGCEYVYHQTDWNQFDQQSFRLGVFCGAVKPVADKPGQYGVLLNIIQHFENKVIRQSGLFGNEIRLEVQLSTVQKSMPAASMPKVKAGH